MGGATIHHPGWVGDPLNTPLAARNYAKRTHAPAGTTSALPDIMSNLVIFGRFALDNISECGMTETDIEADVQTLVSGDVTPAQLLSVCMMGADPDRAKGWRDYVIAVTALAKVFR